MRPSTWALVSAGNEAAHLPPEGLNCERARREEGSCVRLLRTVRTPWTPPPTPPCICARIMTPLLLLIVSLLLPLSPPPSPLAVDGLLCRRLGGVGTPPTSPSSLSLRAGTAASGRDRCSWATLCALVRCFWPCLLVVLLCALVLSCSVGTCRGAKV